jgi:hypothetical protein
LLEKKRKKPGWDAAAERRDVQDELHSAAQARAWAGGADHGFAFDRVGRPAQHYSRARGLIGVGAAAVRMGLLHKKKKKKPRGGEAAS